jgi:predicted membrane-bound spermidine synthase
MMRRALCAVFFLSGAAALLFENLWFRQAGLAFGNSVWASSLVLASFMAGLALGNALAASRGGRLRRPVRVYGSLELTVGVAGALLVVALPLVGGLLLALQRGLDGSPAATNGLRLLAAFALLVVPTTAMGLTLPVLTRALAAKDVAFGEALGALYGWNTVGAVAGALAVEAALVPRLGVRGTAFAAGFLSAVAALLALRVSARFEPLPVGPEGTTPLASPGRLSGEARRLLLAAFLTGGALLALEVVWFRLLVMFCAGTSLTFALLLAVVLLGIGLGGLTAAAWLKRRPDAHRSLLPLLCAAGALVVLPYHGLAAALSRLYVAYFWHPLPIAGLAFLLAFPACLLSGLLFTFLGASVQLRVREEAAAAGALTMANTLGAMTGALAGGFLLLPALGIERSLFLLAGLYGVAALVLPGTRRALAGRPLLLRPALGAAWLGSLVLFPFGLMERTYLRLPLRQYTGREFRVVALREGLTETAMYAEVREDGRPLYHRLVTNGFSMSGTSWNARRYMGLYVWLPAALHPRLDSALLVSYGVGNTAQSLVRTTELRTIDVVDISRDILELSSVVHDSPPKDPLRDPRVRVHVEDGRAFLEATAERYDLITSEPPPPRNAGVVNLYSKEYFALLRSRLREGGMVTYWLPLHSVSLFEARAITGAFCHAFPDCSLWSGHDLDWMLLGTRDARGPVGEERLRLQWEDPVVAGDLRAAGLESPAQLGALFLMDAAGLERFVAGAPPLSDNWPGRLSSLARPVDPVPCLEVLDAARARASFETSPLVERLWPKAARAAALEAFAWQSVDYDLSRALYAGYKIPRSRLHELVTRSSARLLVQRLLGSDPDRERVARAEAQRGDDSLFVRAHLAVAALADRDFSAAAERARQARRLEASASLGFLEAYALCLSGRVAEGLAEASSLPASARDFLVTTFGRLSTPR